MKRGAMRMLLGLAVLGLGLSMALAREDEADRRMKVSAAFEPATAKPGAKVTLKITFDVTKGFHTYSTKQEDANAKDFATSIEFPDLKDLTPAKGDFKEPKAKIHEDKELKAKLAIFEEKAVIEKGFTVFPKAGPGERKVKVKILTQVCDDKGCVPFSKTLEVPLTIEK